MQEDILLKGQELSREYTLPSENVSALVDVSLKVSRGELLAVMGPSGSGKTTLLNLLGGLDRQTGGRVWWQEHCLNNLRESEIARLRSSQVGLIFQDARLMGGLNALDNVRLPLILSRREDSRGWPTSLLTRLGLESKLNRLPRQLSRGEQHRVAIARALVTRPLSLLADEPTGNLDREATRTTFSFFKELCEEDGLGVVVATHDQSILEFATHLLRLSDGRVVEEATTSSGSTLLPRP